MSKKILTRSFRRKTKSRSRSNHGGMFSRKSGAAAEPAPAPAPLTFAAMDAAAAATTDHDELEAIRLTKQIVGQASVTFRELDGVDYLIMDTKYDSLTPIWQLIRLMERRVAFAARHRDVMLASSAELCGQLLPQPQPQPKNATPVSPKERMRALGAMQRSMIMHQLTHGMAPRDAKKMTDCMTQYQASQVNHGMSIAVENALRTINTIKSVGWKRQVVHDVMMFPVNIRPLVPKSAMMEHPLAQFVASYVKKPVGQIGRTHQELQRTALQKLCDTLMPSDVLVAIATKIEYDARQPSGDYIPEREH